MSFDEVSPPLTAWSKDGLRAAVATLVQVKHRAPRSAGARLAVNERGDIAGSVSNGCVESDLYEHLQQVLSGAPPRMVHYGITDEMAMSVGLSCGGEIDVLAAPYRSDDSAWRMLAEQRAGDQPAVLVTGLSESCRGRSLCVLPDGACAGTLGDAGLDQRAGALAAEALEREASAVVRIDQPEAELFVEVFVPPPRLAIVGATPVGAALCHLAHFLGMAVSVIDPRPAFATRERFPDARRILHVWPREGLEQIAVDRFWHVVVLAHDTKLDVPALAAALKAGCRYVGQIGSRRTQQMRRDALLAEGFSEEDINRIHGPVGLDIRAVTPEEIALSILAEMVQVRRASI